MKNVGFHASKGWFQLGLKTVVDDLSIVDSTRRQQLRHQKRRMKDDDGYNILGSEAWSADLWASGVYRLMETTYCRKHSHWCMLTEASKALTAFVTVAAFGVTESLQKRTVRPTTQSGSVNAAILDSTEPDIKPFTTLMMMPRVHVVHNSERVSDNETSVMKKRSSKLEIWDVWQSQPKLRRNNFGILHMKRKTKFQLGWWCVVKRVWNSWAIAWLHLLEAHFEVAQCRLACECSGFR